MNKLVRRIATAAASLVFVGGALLAAGGSASAAAVRADAHVPARAGVAAPTQTVGGNHGGYAGDGSDGSGHHWSLSDRHGWDRYTCDRFYLWVWDQLRTFGYDGSHGPLYFGNEWHRGFSSDDH